MTLKIIHKSSSWSLIERILQTKLLILSRASLSSTNFSLFNSPKTCDRQKLNRQNVALFIGKFPLCMSWWCRVLSVSSVAAFIRRIVTVTTTQKLFLFDIGLDAKQHGSTSLPILELDEACKVTHRSSENHSEKVSIGKTFINPFSVCLLCSARCCIQTWGMRSLGDGTEREIFSPPN